MHTSRRSETANHDHDDPFLTPDEMAEVGRMARSTFQRRWRHDPMVEAQLVRLSARKLGMRRSKWLAILEGARKP